MAVRHFQEMGDNLQLIMRRLLSNQNLMKLLYYTDKDPLAHDDLDEATIQKEIFQKIVKIVPKVNPEEAGAHSVISIRVLGGDRLRANAEFKTISLSLEIFTPLEQWIIKDTSLRPFLIMGEIEKSLNGKTINGLGKLTNGGFDLSYLTDEVSCYLMSFDIEVYV